MMYSGWRRRAAVGLAAVVGTLCVGVFAPASDAADTLRAAPGAAAAAGLLRQPVPGSLLSSILSLLDDLLPLHLRFPLPAPRPSLTFSYTQGKGAPSPTTTGPCDTLLVQVDGHFFPPALYGMGELDFYGTAGELLDHVDYSWNPQGPQTQVLGVVTGTALASPDVTPNRPVTVVVAGHPGVSGSFALECTRASGAPLR